MRTNRSRKRVKVPTNIALTPQMRLWLRRQADAQGLSVSAVVGQLVFVAMARSEAGLNAK